jgi:transcriptional regulator with XRE-family HTH domain
MEGEGLNQSQLARRLGVTQGAIAKVANNNPNGSSFLHKLARELRTTPEYLTGEVDDPDANAPTTKPLNYEQLELVECFDRLSRADQQALLQMARSLASNKPPPKERLHTSPKGFRHEGPGES